MKIKNDFLFSNKLNREINLKVNHFYDYIRLISKVLRQIDELKPFRNNLTSIKEILDEDLSALNIHSEMAWPLSYDEWRMNSLGINYKKFEEKNENKNSTMVGFAYNIVEFKKEIIPPFILIEGNFHTNNSELNNDNILIIKIGKEIYFFNDFGVRKMNLIDKLCIIHEMIINYAQEKLSSNENRPLFLLTDISLSCIEAEGYPKEQAEKLFKSTQNLISLLKSLNIIPISIVDNENSPLLAAIAKYFISKSGLQCMECKKNKLYSNLSLCDLFELVTDKIFLYDKLKIKERSPILNYTNLIFEENKCFSKENILIFYLRCDINKIQRIEIPSYSLEYIDKIHFNLINQFEICKKKMKKQNFYLLCKAKNNLLTIKKSKKEIIKVIDSFLRKETTKQYKKEIGLILNIN